MASMYSSSSSLPLAAASSSSDSRRLADAYREVDKPEHAGGHHTGVLPFGSYELDAFGYIAGMRSLAQRFPLGLAAQAELIQPSDLAELSSDALAQMIDAARAAVSAGSADIEVMLAQIAEKRRQINLLRSLTEAQKDCIRSTMTHLEELESYAHARGVVVEDELAEKQWAQDEMVNVDARASDTKDWEEGDETDEEDDSDGSSVDTEMASPAGSPERVTRNGMQQSLC